MNEYFEKKIYVTVMLLCSFLFSCFSLYTALHPLLIPNVSFVFYGLTLITLYRLVTMMPRLILSLVINQKKYRSLIALMIVILSLFHLFTGLVSFYSTKVVFPNPITYIVMSTLIYGFAFVMTFLFLYQGILIQREELGKRLQVLKKQIDTRGAALQKWQSEEEKLPKKKKKKKKNRHYEDQRKLDEYFMKKFLGLIPWLVILVWVFVIIPIESYNTIDQIPPFYLLWMTITILFAIYKVVMLINVSTSLFSIDEETVHYKSFLKNTVFPLKSIQGIFIENEFVRMKNQNKTIMIELKALKKPDEFWETIESVFPVELIYITEEGWTFLKKLSPKTWKEFAEKYNKALFIDFNSSFLD